jgi:hypothetical protein
MSSYLRIVVYSTSACQTQKQSRIGRELKRICADNENLRKRGRVNRDHTRKAQVAMFLLFRVIRVNPRPILLVRFASAKNKGIIKVCEWLQTSVCVVGATFSTCLKTQSKLEELGSIT